jgi:hypothetical protein
MADAAKRENKYAAAAPRFRYCQYLFIYPILCASPVCRRPARGKGCAQQTFIYINDFLES